MNIEDDVYCAVNNINGYVFIVDKDSLKSNSVDHTKIAKAIEEIKKYVRGKNND